MMSIFPSDIVASNSFTSSACNLNDKQNIAPPSPLDLLSINKHFSRVKEASLIIKMAPPPEVCSSNLLLKVPFLKTIFLRVTPFAETVKIRDKSFASMHLPLPSISKPSMSNSIPPPYNS